jgi:hypothetical protein
LGWQVVPKRLSGSSCDPQARVAAEQRAAVERVLSAAARANQERPAATAAQQAISYNLIIIKSLYVELAHQG